MKYTDGHNEVDAFQVCSEIQPVPEWLVSAGRTGVVQFHLGKDASCYGLRIERPSGNIVVNPGEWITIDEKGTIGKIEKDVFYKSYYAVESEPITDSERLAFLHSTNVDSEGFEYGVAKVKCNEHGQIITTLWTNSDHSDIDKLILEGRKALAKPKIPEGFKVPEGYKLVPIDSDRPKTGIVCSSCGASPLLEPCQGNPDYCAMKSTPVVNRNVYPPKGFRMKLPKVKEDNMNPVLSPEMKENLFGTPELLEHALKLCSELSKLPTTEDRIRISSLVADATFALQKLQETGNYHWPA